MSEETTLFTMLAVIAAVALAWMDGRWRVLAGLWRALAWTVQRWKYFAITFGAGAGLVFFTRARGGEEFALIGMAILAVMAIGAWGREFLHLMASGDDAFPGRADKLVWGLSMLLIPPVGAVLYHRHRTRNAPVKNFSARKPASFELS